MILRRWSSYLTNKKEAMGLARTIWKKLDEGEDLDGDLIVKGMDLFENSSLFRGTMESRRLAKRVLRQGSSYALSSYGPVATVACLSSVGWWDEVRQLWQSQSSLLPGSFWRYALQDPSLGPSDVMEGIKRAPHECGVEGSVAKSLRRRNKWEQCAHLGWWCRDEGRALNDVMLWTEAASSLGEMGRWDEALMLWGESKTLPHRVALQWAERGGSDLNVAQKIWKYAGESGGGIVGASVAASLCSSGAVGSSVRKAMGWGESVLGQDARGWKEAMGAAMGVVGRRGGPKEGAVVVGWGEKGAPEGALREDVDEDRENRIDSNKLTQRGGWGIHQAAERGIRQGDGEGLRWVMEALEGMGRMGFLDEGWGRGSVVAWYAGRGEVEKAMEGVERMVQEGIQPYKATWEVLGRAAKAKGGELECRVWDMAGQHVKLDTGMCNQWARALLRQGKVDQCRVLGERMQSEGVRFDAATYCVLVSGFSSQDCPNDALFWARKATQDPYVVPTEQLFTAMRSMCRTHGMERAWPPLRQWCQDGGVKTGMTIKPWRDGRLDPLTNDASVLLYPQ